MWWFDPIDQLGFRSVVAFHGNGPGARFLAELADQFVGNPMVKMAPIVMLLLYVWVRRDDRMQRGGILSSAELTVRGVLAIGIALVAGRALQIVMPMRPRPRFAHPELAFPPTAFSHRMDDWSSMPSDHAMVVAAVVAIIWMASRRHAVLAAAWGLAFVCFSRVAVGLHYASDILVGFVLGLVLAFAVMRTPLPSMSWTWLQRLDERRPALVFLGLFLFGWGLGDMFASARWFLSVLQDGFRADKLVALALVSAMGALAVAALAAGFLARQNHMADPTAAGLPGAPVKARIWRDGLSRWRTRREQ